MLVNNLYKVVSFEESAGKVIAALQLNTMHPVFEGHFPGQPVLPGVCMMQMVKEITEKAIHTPLFMHEVVQAKFLSMADPTQTPLLQLTIDYVQEGATVVSVNAALKTAATVLFKMTARLQMLPQKSD